LLNGEEGSEEELEDVVFLLNLEWGLGMDGEDGFCVLVLEERGW
jgi:hypothetical protein